MKAIEEEGNWEEQKRKLKLKFAALSDNDNIFASGSKDEIAKKNSN